MQRPEKILGTTGGRSQQIHSLTHSQRATESHRLNRPSSSPIPAIPNQKPKLNRGEENQLCIILSIDICGRQSLFGALTLYSSLPLPSRPSAILSFSLIHSLFVRMCVCFCVQHFFIASLSLSLSFWHFPLCLLAASHFRFGNFRNFTLNYSQAY